MVDVVLTSSDSKEYKVSQNAISQSNLIKNMLNDLDIVDGTPIPLPNVTSQILEIVIQVIYIILNHQYLNMHVDDVPPTEPVKKSLDDILPEDAELVKVPHKVLFDIILAANYLDIPGLLDLGCKTVANNLKNKTIDEVQTEYEIPKEHWFTEEERAKIDEEIRWANGGTNATSPKRTHYIQTHYESQTHLTQFVTDQVDRVKSFKYDSEPSLNNIKHQSRRKSKSTSKIQYVVAPTLTANKFNSTFAKRLSVMDTLIHHKIKSIANQSSKTGIFRNGKISNPLKIGGLSVTIDPKSPIPAQANLSQPNSPVHLTDFDPIFLDGSPKYSLGHFDFDRVSNPFDLGSTNQCRTPFDLEIYANMQDEQDVRVENKDSDMLPEIPGELMSDRYLLNELKELVCGLLEADINPRRFPGAQPVSFGGYHIDELKQENYFVSEKADGIRCLLFTRTLKDLTVESYLIDRKNNYYKHRFGLPMPKLKTSHRHTIVDGELVIEQKTGRDPELYFLLFDALVVDEKNLTRRPYTSRLGYLRQHVIQPYQESCAKNPKYRKLFPFTFRQKRLELSYQLPIVFRHMQSYQHETDGVIFTSAVAPYTFGTCDKMLKWKPAEENTVDFKILKVQVNGEFERHLGILIQNEEYEDFGKLTLDSATEEKYTNQSLMN
ncbi:Dcp1p-Dcp2p decapping enzyme complex alpha subunit [Globomyces sp. JEL0801]|nr:Dcp1p-Dcp2p decapping enzyme complex alpha subunit [Globomyces sp. JEL0801]